MAAAVHDTLRMAPAARGEGDGITDAGRAVQVDVAGAVQRVTAEYIVAAEVHPCNVDVARPRLMRCQHECHCDQPGRQRVSFARARKDTGRCGASWLKSSTNEGFQAVKCSQIFTLVDA